MNCVINRSWHFVRAFIDSICNFRSTKSTEIKIEEKTTNIEQPMTIKRYEKPSIMTPFGCKTIININEKIDIQIKKRMFLINGDCSQTITNIHFMIPANLILMINENINFKSDIIILDNNIPADELVELSVIARLKSGIFFIAAGSIIANGKTVTIEPFNLIQCVPKKSFMLIFLSIFENECKDKKKVSKKFKLETIIAKFIKYNCNDVLMYSEVYDREPIYYIKLDERAISPIANRSSSESDDLIYKFPIYIIENVIIGPQQSKKIESGFFFFRNPGLKNCRYFIQILTLPHICKRGIIPIETIIDMDIIRFAVTIKNMSLRTQTLLNGTQIVCCVLRKSM